MLISGLFAWAAVASVLLSMLVCAALLLGAFQRRALALSAREQRLRVRAPEPFVPGRAPFLGVRLDVGLEIRAALEEFASEASDRFVVVDAAIAPNLLLHADRDALRTIVNILVDHAIRQAQEQVLVSVMQLGARIQIAVTDDGSGATAAEQQAILRPVAELAALQGGTIDIETWPGQGTTVAVRLPAFVENQRRPEQDRRTPLNSQSFADEGELAAEASWEI
jgi:signal transduction histidine kinase